MMKTKMTGLRFGFKFRIKIKMMKINYPVNDDKNLSGPP